MLNEIFYLIITVIRQYIIFAKENVWIIVEIIKTFNRYKKIHLFEYICMIGYVTFSKICRIVKKNLIYEMTKDKKKNHENNLQPCKLRIQIGGTK